MTATATPQLVLMNEESALRSAASSGRALGTGVARRVALRAETARNCERSQPGP